jgi:hypothetical protein
MGPITSDACPTLEVSFFDAVRQVVGPIAII